MSTPLDDLVDTLAVLRPLRVELQELRESENRVERRTQLVAHAGEEVALGVIGASGFCLRALPLCDLALELFVGGTQLERALVHPLLEFVRVALHALAKPRLFEGDRELRGRFPSDADLLGRELARRSAEAHGADELVPGHPGPDHVREDARGEQGLRVRAAR